MSGLQKLKDFLIANWVSLSFLATISVALYVRFKFRIDYFFDKYRDIHAKRNLGEFYRRLGDRFMAAAEWEAAEEAYITALKMDPHNTEATYGLVKSQVFHFDSRKTWIPEVADIKLRYLGELLSRDSDVHFLQGIRYMDRGDLGRARNSFHEAIKEERRDCGFVGAYLQLGYLEQKEGRVEEAVRNYERALEIDPDFYLANQNLGHCYILAMRFPEAIKCKIMGDLSDSAHYDQHGRCVSLPGPVFPGGRLAPGGEGGDQRPPIQKRKICWRRVDFQLHGQ